MEAFCKADDSSVAFCKVGDAAKAENAVSAATRDEIKRFWELDDGEDATKQRINEVCDAESYGNKLFCEGRVADAKLLCDVHVTENTPVHAFGNGFLEVGDVETDDWVSPRISFSQDFVMADIYPLSQNTPPSERKNGEHDSKDNYSAEFAFSKDGPAHGAVDQAKGFMLSADELFFDGKLLPLPFPSIWAASDDLGLSSSRDKHRQEVVQKSHNRPISRHLSFEIPKPSSSTTTSSFSLRSTCACISSPCKSSRLDTSLSYSDACAPFSLSLPSSPSASSSLSLSSLPILASSSSMSLPPTSPAPLPLLPSALLSSSLLSSSILSMTSTSSLPSSSVTKCSTKLKDLFKSKKFSKDSSPSQLMRDNSVTATCRLPISSRSFWPFSRSNSAGVSKSTAPPSLTCRSNSAGDSHTCVAPSSKELDATDVARLSTSSLVGCSKAQGPVFTVHEENSQTTEVPVPLEVASVEENSNACDPSSHEVDTCVDSPERRAMSENVKSLGFQGQSKSSGKKVIGTPGKGSPGKRKGVSGSSGVKVNGEKIVLRNLERCSAEKKLGRGLNRRGSFPVGARVSPVLNVAVYRGPSTPKIGLFRFNTLLFSKKEKPADASINWRNRA